MAYRFYLIYFLIKILQFVVIYGKICTRFKIVILNKTEVQFRVKIVKKGISVALALVIAQSAAFTSYGVGSIYACAASSQMYSSSVKTNTSSTSKVTLSKSSANLVVGKTLTLKATVSPAGVSSELKWTSSNTKVVTVDANGKVKAVGKGIANVTVKTSNGKTAVCMFTVITEQEAFADEVLKLVNAERAKVGAPKLRINAGLAKASNKRAVELYTKFSHTRPNGSQWYTVLKEYSVSYSSCAENIAYNYDTPKEVVAGWMKSSGHKKNILNPKYTKIGIGYYKNGDRVYWVQLFSN